MWVFEEKVSPLQYLYQLRADYGHVTPYVGRRQELDVDNERKAREREIPPRDQIA